MPTTIKEFNVKIKLDTGALKQSAKGAETSLSGLTKKSNTTKGSFDFLGKNIVKVGGALVGIVGGVMLVQKAFTTLTNAVSGLVTSTMDFETSFANVTTLVDTSVVNVAALEAGILDLAGELGSAKELTDGLYQALSAGIEPAKAVEFVGEAARLAKGGLIEMGDATKLLAGTMNAYGLDADEANRVSGIFFQTIKDGITTGSELSGALGTITSVAAPMGVSLEQVAAAMATMTKANIDTNVASTSLRAILSSVTDATDDVKIAARGMGVDFSLAGLQSKGLHGWLMSIKDATGGNVEEIAKLFPNIRALTGALALTGEQAGGYADELKRMSDEEQIAANTAEAFEKQQKTLAAQIEALKNKFEAAFVKIILPKLKEFATWIDDNSDNIVRFFDNFASSVGRAVESLSSLSKKLVANAGVISRFLKFISPTFEGVTTLSKAFVSWSLSQGAVVDEQKKVNKVVADAKPKVDGLSDRLSFYNKVTEDSTGWTKAFGDAVGGKGKGTTKKIEDLSKEMQIAADGAALDLALEFVNVGDEAFDAGEEIGFLESGIGNLEPKMDGAGKKTKTFSDKMQDLNAAMEIATKIGKSFTDFLVNVGGLSQDAGQAIGGVVEGVGSIAAGLAAGPAGIPAIVAGGLGIITQAFSLLTGPSGEFEAAERRLQGLTGTTQDWTEKIEELAKSMSGGDTAGRAFNSMLGEIIKSSDVTVDNFNNYINKVREIVSAYEDHNASLAETEKNFGTAFSAMVSKAEELGLVGGQAFTGMIMLADEFGLDVKEVTDFVEQRTNAAFTGWKDVVSVLGDVSIPLFDEMARKEAVINSITDETRTLIDGATAALINLSDAKRLDSAEWEEFNNIVNTTRERLEAQGITGADAAMAMAPLLERMAFLQKEYGFQVDDATQKLIDQGVEAGVLSEDTRSDTEIMRDGFKEVTDALKEVAGILRGDLPDAVKSFGGTMSNTTADIDGDLRRLRNGLEGVKEKIEDTTDELEKMGDMSDDVMWENSIIPDIETWKDKLGEVNTVMDKNTTKAISRLDIAPPGMPSSGKTRGKVLPPDDSIMPIGGQVESNSTYNLNMGGINHMGNESDRQLAEKIRFLIRNNVGGLTKQIQGVN